MKYKVGDTVETQGECCGSNLDGLSGVTKEINDSVLPILIEFFKQRPWMHSGLNSTVPVKHNHCWWVHEKNIKRRIPMYKVGDVLVDKNNYERIVLEVLTQSVLLSTYDNQKYVRGWFSFQELEDMEYKLKTEPEETIITMDEVAKKFGIPVEKLKIKKD